MVLMLLCFSIMAESVPSVALPVIPGFLNLAVFPSHQAKRDETRFFLLSNSASVPEFSSKVFKVEYIPGSIYCLFPSTEESQWNMCFFPTRPCFIKNYTYCLEIKKTALGLNNLPAGSTQSHSKLKEDSSTKTKDACSNCFISHFPSPNRTLCKWKMPKSSNSFSVRLRGGARNQYSKPIIESAVANAKAHGIDLHAGPESLGDGNCAFESIIDSINTRSCFHETIDGTPDHWRFRWLTEVEDIAYNVSDNGLSEDEWKTQWSILKTSRTYEMGLADLVLPCIAHCVQKDILIFNTSEKAHAPVYVVESSMLSGQAANNEVPICLAYNLVHFEPLLPDTDDDVMKTVTLKNEIVQGTYNKSVNNIPCLNLSTEKECRSYAAAVKRRKKEEGKEKGTKERNESCQLILTSKSTQQ